MVFDTRSRYLVFTEYLYYLSGIIYGWKNKSSDIFYIQEKEGHPTRHVLSERGVGNPTKARYFSYYNFFKRSTYTSPDL